VSGIDPLAGLVARVAAAEAAMLEAAINLGATADALQAQITAGDVLAAKVLPPQGGRDLIEILGQPVVAQLPPGVRPGETLLLQVTGFGGTQIFVRNLGVAQSEPAQTPASQPAPQQEQPVSPPRAVFVAASVRAAPAQPAAAVRGIEARIAATQAAKIPPAIVTRTPSAPAPVAQRAPLAQSSVIQTAARAVTRTVQTVSEFLRAARLPDTPFTRMAATIAPHAPERLPSVLQRLEAALPHAAQDARIPTLRTLIGFTSRLNPANAETLRAQISSYVSNVVEGVEVKLSQLLQAHTQAGTPVRTPGLQPPQQQPQQQPQQPDAPAVSQTIAQARVAERSAAISHDLKSVVLSLLRDPPAERTPAMTQALSETLITLTGVQVNALSSNQQTPGTINFALPVYYHEGGKPAQIRISRDAESRAGKLDADNFHVAFVLDTANLGTVAIDVQTTGRTVKVDVKTENKPAADRFSDTLSSLRARLEDLRYRVACAAANALPSAAKAEQPLTVSPPKSNVNDRGLDLRA
jgi:hypothetical protein